MKNVIYILIMSIILFPVVFSDENIQKFDYGLPIEIYEVVENSSGLPCKDCSCNLSLYNPNGTYNSSYDMQNRDNGIYNVTLPQLDINLDNDFYPVIIQCNNTNENGISSINAIRVVPRMFDFTSLALIMISMPFLFAFIGVRLDPSDETKVWMKWIFIGLSILMIIADMVFANIIAQYTGITGLPDFFNTFITITYFVFAFFIFGLIYYLIKINNAKVAMRKKDEDN